MNLWHDLEPGPNVPDVVHVIVEIPKGSRNKYEYHKQTGALPQRGRAFLHRL